MNGELLLGASSNPCDERIKGNGELTGFDFDLLLGLKRRF